jgi:Tfp pilus assembly protein FimT
MSLAEVLIVIAVISVLVLVVLPEFFKNKEMQMLKNGVENTLSSIDKARTETLSSLDSSSYGVHFESHEIVIFKGVVYSANDANNEIIDIISPANISKVNFAGVNANTGNIYFNRLSGMPNQTGTITLSTPS